MKNTLHKLTVLLTILFFPFIIKGQTNYQEPIYINNDRIIEPSNEQFNTSNKKDTDTTQIKQSGFTNITEINFGPLTGQFSSGYAFGIQTINGYLFNPNFSLGFGIGIDGNEWDTFIPLFADFRVNFLKTKVTPFLSTDIGYSMHTMNDKSGQIYTSGLLVNPNFGIKVFVSTKTALNFSIGYRIQEVDHLSYTQYKIYYLNFKLGATF